MAWSPFAEELSEIVVSIARRKETGFPAQIWVGREGLESTAGVTPTPGRSQFLDNNHVEILAATLDVNSTLRSIRKVLHGLGNDFHLATIIAMW